MNEAFVAVSCSCRAAASSADCSSSCQRAPSPPEPVSRRASSPVDPTLRSRLRPSLRFRGLGLRPRIVIVHHIRLHMHSILRRSLAISHHFMPPSLQSGLAEAIHQVAE